MIENFVLLWAPKLPIWLIASLGGGFVLLFLYGLFKGLKGTFFRALFFSGVLLWLLGPMGGHEERLPLKDKVLVVVDRSQSQLIDQRPAQSQAVLSQLDEKLASYGSVEVEKLFVSNLVGEGTDLFEPIEQRIAEIGEERLAAVLVISDGIVQPLPEGFESTVPWHLFLTGKEEEKDRRLKALSHPRYAVLGEETSFSLKMEQLGDLRNSQVPLEVRVNGELVSSEPIVVDEEKQLALSFEEAGEALIELSVPTEEEELSTSNNKLVFRLSVVRDGLSVLLVSGRPHPGERTWRNLLTADPAVSLFHFTILRERGSVDFTPQNELALIPFPTRRLFSEKLNDFDLIIMDNYDVQGLLNPAYFENITRYVEQGGALLLAVGPGYGGKESLFYTQLRSVLPAQPKGPVLSGKFRPVLSEVGRSHPITKTLAEGSENWGSWFRMVALEPMNPQSDHVLMTGLEGEPLLVAGRKGKGRVALLGSEQIWLWSRGFEGGGPQAELLRRLAHWAMQEPELEEEALHVRQEGEELLIEHQSLAQSAHVAKVTDPQGRTEEITLQKRTAQGQEEGVSQALYPLKELGFYEVEVEGLRQLFSFGGLGGPELSSLGRTDQILAPFIHKTGGRVLKMDQDPFPSIVLRKKGRSFQGNKVSGPWIGLLERQAYRVEGSTQKAFLPSWLALLLLFALLFFAWLRESR